MRKNVLKKLVAIVATTAMAVTAIIANPTEAKAATEKEIYLEVEEDAEYAWGYWNSGSGITFNAEYMSGSDWQYLFTKVEDGLYKINVTVDGTVALSGFQLYKNGAEIAKCDIDWNSSEYGLAVQTLLNSNATKIKLSNYDSTAWAFKTAEEIVEQETTTAGAAEETTTAGASGETTTVATDVTSTGTPDTGDTTMVALYLAIAALGAVVVLSRKKVNE